MTTQSMTITESPEPSFEVDRSNLVTLKKRFLAFNRKRLERTLSSLNSRQQLFLELIPLMFHVNHPVLPGYTSGKPRIGIINFKPDKALLKKARQHAKSFRYPVLKSRAHAVLSIYVMGSIGTIGQSRSSDLDFWICYDPRISPRDIELLRQRCDGIQQWAATIGLEVCFFLMDADAFREGHHNELSEESSGSTQHKLLLDEFYRTAIHLAGQYPLWWFVPPEHECHYRQYSQLILSKRFLRETEVIDLGGLDNIPPQEFITAAVWQLYKAIESPYKSLLKLMLLEVYTRRKSDADILSVKLKQSIYDNRVSVDYLDPYLLLFNSLVEYLQTEQFSHRIELVRRCFYFKVNKPLSKAPKNLPASWQRRLLADIVNQWGWDEETIATVDGSQNGKARQVIEEKQRLMSELLNSYRFLSEYAHNLDPISTAQLQHDIAILGRKFYAAFERKSGKIESININISKDISEDYVTFYQHQNSHLNWQWEVLPQKKFEAPNLAQSLQSSTSLIELFTWCFNNRVITERTSANIKHNGRDLDTQSLFCAYSQWLNPEKHERLKPDFEQRPVPKNILLVINALAEEDTSNLSTEYPSVNPLSVGKDRRSLLRNIHLVCHNSWNEVTVHSYDSHPLEYLIREWLTLFNNSADCSECEVTFHCDQIHHATSLKIRLEQVVKQLDRSLVQLSQHQLGRLVIASGEELLCIEKCDQQISVEPLRDMEGLIRHLSKPQHQLCHTAFDPLTLSSEPLAAICRERLSHAIQVFYSVHDERAELYVFDEKNTLVNFQSSFHNEQSLLRPLHRFIRSIISRLQLAEQGSDDFGIYPVEFYQLQRQSTGQYQTIRTHVTTELQNLQFFNIQAIAHPEEAGDVPFSIYCDEQGFRPSELGDDLYRHVARHILSYRQRAERYPCYLTDLDMGLSSQALVGESPLQTADFLKAKNGVEERMNRALQLV